MTAIFPKEFCDEDMPDDRFAREMTAIRSLTLLNQMGDITLVWGEEQDDEMEKIIEKKMKEGVSFFIVESRAFGYLEPSKERLINAADAMKGRALSIPDEDIAKFIDSGCGAVVSSPAEKTKAVRRAKTAKEAAENQTIGVQQRKGG